MKKTKLFHNDKMRRNAGVSLIIATLFTAFFLLLAADLTKTILKSMRMRANYESSSKAYYLAKSASEIASKWTYEHGIGANSEDSQASRDAATRELIALAIEAGVRNCADTDANALGPQPCVGFEVKGRPSDNDNDNDRVHFQNTTYFSSPIKGDGNAAEKCANADEADDPCNWGKLVVNEPVEIPLFYEKDENSNGTIETSEIRKLSDIAGFNFRLRIRTPCKEFAMNHGFYACSLNEVLYPIAADNKNNPQQAGYPFRHTKKDLVLVQWLIQDQDSDKVLLAKDDISSIRGQNDYRPWPDADGVGIDPRSSNTELSAGRINDASNNIFAAEPGQHMGELVLRDYLVLENNYFGNFIQSSAQIQNEPKTIANFIQNTNRPVLRLMLLTYPQKDDGIASTEMTEAQMNDSDFNIPYLEYQALTTRPVSDSASNVTAWAIVNDFRKQRKVKVERPVSSGGFVMEQF